MLLDAVVEHIIPMWLLSAWGKEVMNMLLSS